MTSIYKLGSSISFLKDVIEDWTDSQPINNLNNRHPFTQWGEDKNNWIPLPPCDWKTRTEHKFLTRPRKTEDNP